MTTPAPARADARPEMRPEARPGTAAFALSAGLAVAAFVSSAGSLLIPDVVAGPAATRGSLQGTAVVILGAALPLLLASMWLAARCSLRARLTWLAAAGYIAYQGVLFVFGTPINRLFLAYEAMLALAVWSVIAIAGALPVAEIAARYAERTPVRAVSTYIVVNAVAFGVLWLGAIVPSITQPFPPAYLDGTGMLTNPVHVIDLGFTLPLMFAAAHLLWRRRPWGYALSTTLLVMLVIETASIGVDQWFAATADPTSLAASMSIVPLFAVLTVIGSVPAVVMVRSLRDPRRG